MFCPNKKNLTRWNSRWRILLNIIRPFGCLVLFSSWTFFWSIANLVNIVIKLHKQWKSDAGFCNKLIIIYCQYKNVFSYSFLFPTLCITQNIFNIMQDHTWRHYFLLVGHTLERFTISQATLMECYHQCNLQVIQRFCSPPKNFRLTRLFWYSWR